MTRTMTHLVAATALSMASGCIFMPHDADHDNDAAYAADEEADEEAEESEELDDVDDAEDDAGDTAPPEDDPDQPAPEFAHPGQWAGDCVLEQGAEHRMGFEVDSTGEGVGGIVLEGEPQYAEAWAESDTDGSMVQFEVGGVTYAMYLDADDASDELIGTCEVSRVVHSDNDVVDTVLCGVLLVPCFGGDGGVVVSEFGTIRLDFVED